MGETGYIKFSLETWIQKQEAEKTHEYPICIQNVVCTAWTGHRTDMIRVCIVCHGRFDKRVFPACVSRCLSPSSTNSIFESGKIVSVGNKTPEDALLSIHKFVNLMNTQMNLDLRVLNFCVENIVGSAGLPYRLDLDKMKAAHDVKNPDWDFVRFPGTVSYEPLLFPGASYKPDATKRKAEEEKNEIRSVGFPSGKMLIVGCKTSHEMVDAYRRMLPIYWMFRENGDAIVGLSYIRITQDIETKRHKKSLDRENRKQARQLKPFIPVINLVPGSLVKKEEEEGDPYEFAPVTKRIKEEEPVLVKKEEEEMDQFLQSDMMGFDV